MAVGMASHCWVSRHFPHGLQVPEEQGAISWLLWDVGGWVQAGEEKLAGCGML